MAIKITEECINCGACEPECPNNAIYEGGVEWAIADGTSVKGPFTLLDGSVVDAEAKNAPVSVDIYYITPNKCTECQGFHEEPQCAAVCPVMLRYEASDLRFLLRRNDKLRHYQHFYLLSKLLIVIFIYVGSDNPGIFYSYQ